MIDNRVIEEPSGIEQCHRASSIAIGHRRTTSDIDEQHRTSTNGIDHRA